MGEARDKDWEGERLLSLTDSADRASIIAGLKEAFVREYGEYGDACRDSSGGRAGGLGGGWGNRSGEIALFFAPGRVNLIGEHTDYNGGFVLPSALSLGIWAAVRFTGKRTVNLRSVDFPGKTAVSLDEDIRFEVSEGWANYSKGVIRHLQSQEFEVPGCEILFAADLPSKAGLSSSAALEVLTGYLLLYPSQGECIDRVSLARLCQIAENEFVGVKCGIMDQFAVAMGRKDAALLLDCSTLEHEFVPLNLGEHVLVIMDTGKKRGLESSKYNQRRLECEKALEAIRRHKPVSSLCRATMADVFSIEDKTAMRRARHAVSENLRTLEAARLLRQGDLAGFGRLMVQSHDSLRDDYEVTGFELDTIVHDALAFDGCIGARMTGAGFGGSAIALVRKDKEKEFIRAVSQSYAGKTGLLPRFYTCVAGDGVQALGLPVKGVYRCE